MGNYELKINIYSIIPCIIDLSNVHCHITQNVRHSFPNVFCQLVLFRRTLSAHDTYTYETKSFEQYM